MRPETAPNTIQLMRHGVSTFNTVRREVKKDLLYNFFERQYNKNKYSLATKLSALYLAARHPYRQEDRNTPLNRSDIWQIHETAEALKTQSETPDVIIISPYVRTIQTFEALTEVWPELLDARIILDNRIREKDHGKADSWANKFVYFALHPKQARRYDREGSHEYQFQNGESTPQMLNRLEQPFHELETEFAGKKVLYIGHFLSNLGMRSHIEGWDTRTLLEHKARDFFANAGVTLYKNTPNGIQLIHANKQFYGATPQRVS